MQAARTRTEATASAVRKRIVGMKQSEAVRRSGAAQRHVCVSQLQMPDVAEAGGAPCVTLVTAPGWCGSYPEASGWLVRLEEELGSLACSR